MPWSPAKGSSSFELQRNPQEEKHSRRGKRKILYCSFEMVPTQFPQSNASNSFSILTAPHYCLSRETPNLSSSGDLISRDSKDSIAKSTQIVLGKQKLIKKKITLQWQISQLSVSPYVSFKIATKQFLFKYTWVIVFLLILGYHEGKDLTRGLDLRNVEMIFFNLLCVVGGGGGTP